MSLDRKQTGQLGEQLALSYLKEAGYQIKHANWRCKAGEIDIVAEADGRIVFIEVRTRKTNEKFGSAIESVDSRKQQRIRLTAQFYMQAMKLFDKAIRFDVVAIELRAGDQLPHIKHIQGAF